MHAYPTGPWILARSIIACILLLLVARTAGATDTLARTESGTLRGYRDGAVVVYKGIPFAAPPVGANRWRAPQPVTAWNGERSATQYGRACPQSGVSMPGETPPATSEDCLYLNVWTPARQRDAHLPVLVWIHGGGFSTGTASMPLYRGDRLAAHGLVVITVAYRLGPLGFLALPELSAESPDHASGNYGLMDQVSALRWIQRNVAAFGGDPARVTIAGQSAGATSVSILMASPQARGLFARAIGESGGLFEPMQLAPNYLSPRAEQDGTAYARSVGASTLAELRALPAAALLNVTAATVSHPIVEPVFLPRSPYEVFAAGEQAPVPLLVGSNADEARALVDDLPQISAAHYEDDIRQHWGLLPPSLYQFYPHATDAQAVRARLDFERDLRFGWDAWAWARLAATRGNPAVFYYRFSRVPPFAAQSLRAHWGASHYTELWYVFDHLDYERAAWAASDRRLASVMSSFWVNFARTGDPNGNALPEWPRYAVRDPQVLILDEQVRAAPHPDLPGLRNFDVTYDAVRGQPFGQP